MEVHRHITLSVDLMIVNRYPFMNTISKSIKFVTTDAVSGTKIDVLFKSIQDEVNIYRMCGFKVTHIKID